MIGEIWKNLVLGEIADLSIPQSVDEIPFPVFIVDYVA